MPTTVNLFNSLGGTPSVGGTWSRVSSTGPSAPATYNGTIDFSGFPDGTYEYEYTVVGASTSRVTINYVTSGLIRANDSCENAKHIASTQNSPFEVSTNDDNRGFCDAGLASPTLSPESIPSQWNVGTYNGDLWYQFIPPVCTNVIEINVIVRSIEDNLVGVRGPALEIYKHPATANCSSKTLVISSASSVWEEETQGSLIIYPRDGEQRLKIRVSSPDGYQGQYAVIVTSSTPCIVAECEPCDTPTGDVCWAWGEDDGEYAWGFAPDNVFGESCTDEEPDPEPPTIGDGWGYDGGNVFGFEPTEVLGHGV